MKSKIKHILDTRQDISQLYEKYPDLKEVVETLQTLTDNWTNFDDPTAQELDAEWAKVLAKEGKSKPKRAKASSEVKAKRTYTRAKHVEQTVPGGATKPGKGKPETVAQKFIKRYLRLHGTVVTADQLMRILRPLQKAITNMEIRKTDKHAHMVEKIQHNLIKAYEIAEKEGCVELFIAEMELKGLM